MRVLVVEDNLDLAGSIVTSIEQMQHAVDTIDNGVQAEQMLRIGTPPAPEMQTMPSPDNLSELGQIALLNFSYQIVWHVSERLTFEGLTSISEAVSLSFHA